MLSPQRPPPPHWSLRVLPKTDLLATCHLHRGDVGVDGAVESIHPEDERMFVPFEKEMSARSSLAHVHSVTVRGHVVSVDQSGLRIDAWT